jgi:hypothetical protein
MDLQKVDLFIMTNGKFFEAHYLGWIREKLIQLDEAAWPQLQMMQFKDPTIHLIVSLLGAASGSTALCSAIPASASQNS